MSDNKVIRIDDGSKLCTIFDADGEEIGRFTFRPTDSRFPQRFQEVARALLDCLPEEQEPGFEEAVEKAEREIKAQFDYLLDSSVSDDLLSKYGPLEIMEDGNIFAFHLLESIAGAIEKEIESSGRMMKYGSGKK